MFEKIFGKNGGPTQEDRDINNEINKISDEHYKKVGEVIQEEISKDFERVKYNKDKVPGMISFLENSIKQNPDELSEDLELGEYLQTILKICDGEKYNYNDAEVALQFLRDVDTYKTVYPEKVDEEMSVSGFIYFLQNLEDEAYDFLKPNK